MNKKIIFLVILIVFINNNIFSQTFYKSSKYNYSIEIPENYYKNSNTGNIDMNYYDLNGSSVNIVVVERDFSTSTPHDLQLSTFENLFKNYDKNVKVYGEEKITINNKKAYKFKRFITFTGSSKLYQLSYTFYDNTYQYIITFSCGSDLYLDYEKTFEGIAATMKFN